ncbi:hypothetical protein BDN71DRAFT_1436891 [Pleurotus eryngii]|uniref:Uncharacterized protein n=1 Tax=Pleurotus eryngii TaxID=5323 RepID=A0A9P5ZGN4_PLEER|nr:hypothetical protein BDN71DRAFT_1436891 [Pleurotus eryngii]
MCSYHGSDLWWLSWAWLRHGAVIMMWTHCREDGDGSLHGGLGTACLVLGKKDSLHESRFLAMGPRSAHAFSPEIVGLNMALLKPPNVGSKELSALGSFLVPRSNNSHRTSRSKASAGPNYPALKLNLRIARPYIHRQTCSGTLKPVLEFCGRRRSSILDKSLRHDVEFSRRVMELMSRLGRMSSRSLQRRNGTPDFVVEDTSVETNRRYSALKKLALPTRGAPTGDKGCFPMRQAQLGQREKRQRRVEQECLFVVANIVIYDGDAHPPRHPQGDVIHIAADVATQCAIDLSEVV